MTGSVGWRRLARQCASGTGGEAHTQHLRMVLEVGAVGQRGKVTWACAGAARWAHAPRRWRRRCKTQAAAWAAVRGNARRWARCAAARGGCTHSPRPLQRRRPRHGGGGHRWGALEAAEKAAMAQVAAAVHGRRHEARRRPRGRGRVHGAAAGTRERGGDCMVSGASSRGRRGGAAPQEEGGSTTGGRDTPLVP